MNRRRLITLLNIRTYFLIAFQYIFKLSFGSIISRIVEVNTCNSRNRVSVKMKINKKKTHNAPRLDPTISETNIIHRLQKKI